MKTQEEIKIAIAEEWHNNNSDFNLYNEFANDNSYQEVYENDINEISSFIGDADELVRAVCYGEYHYTDKYVIINVYGNLDSSNNWEDFAEIDDNYYEWLIANHADEIDNLYYIWSIFFDISLKKTISSYNLSQ